MQYYDFKPYVPVAQRRRQAAREMAKLMKDGGRPAPVVIEGRTIARTFWGKAWCENLERYSDYRNRLPRGRTYARNGSVVHLVLSPGKVEAWVSGSSLYQVAIEVKPLADARWKALCKDSAGAIDSVVELLQGRFAQGVMQRLCEAKTGLFPAPSELRFSCTCPDWAVMCKHVAASLYGVGARLDHSPELFFALRQVDEKELIAQAGDALALPAKRPASDRILGADGLSELFGLDLAPLGRKARPGGGKPQKAPARTAPKQAKQANQLLIARPSPGSSGTKKPSRARRVAPSSRSGATAELQLPTSRARRG